MTIEERVTELEEKLDYSVNEIISNMNKLHNHEQKINDNSNRITQNTGAIEVLHTIKTYNNRFFAMWLITFLMLIILVFYTILC